MAVTPSGLHTVLSGLHEGMLTLAALSIILIILSKILKRSSSYSLNNLSTRLFEFAEPTSFVGAFFGAILLFASAYVGMFYTVGGADALTSSPLLMNKVMMSIFAEEFFIIFILARLIYHKEVWNRGILSVVYAVVGLLGFAFTTEAGSLGGTLAGKGSLLDPVYEFTRINPEMFFGLNALETYALLGVTIVMGVVFAYLYRRKKRSSS